MDDQKWVLVITSVDSTTPTVIGPFEDIVVAVKAARILEAGWLTVKLSTINPFPDRLMERLTASKEL